jgi:flagellar biosynthesis/type III secretory pathway M-ring protein FliF/YscJ
VVIEKVEVAPPVIVEKEVEPVKQVIVEDITPYKTFSQRVPDILKDIYEDKMLMFSIFFVGLVVFVMILMSVIRRFKRSRPSEHVKPTDKFGTEEFQRVTIKRLLANGWQVEEIARELNISVEEVEEFGRGK